MHNRLLHLTILSSPFFTAFGAIVTLSTFIEVTKTLPPGGAPPTTSKLQPEATATSKTEHTTTQDSPQSHKTDTVPPPTPPFTTAGTTIQSTSLDPFLSTTESGLSVLISVTTTTVPSLILSPSPTESPTSRVSSPSATASPNAGSTINKGAIIGGASAAGAVLIALIAAAFFWWRRRQCGRDTPAAGSRNQNRNRSSVSEPTNNYRQSILRIKSTFPIFKIVKDSDEASVTSFKSRGMKSLLTEGRNSHAVPTNRIPISAPIQQHPGHDTLTDISKGPYETASQRPSPSHPPMPPIPAYINQRASNEVSTMSVIEEYSAEDTGDRRSNDYSNDNRSQYNQGYPMTRPSPTGRVSRGRGPNQWSGPSSQPSRLLHHSQMTEFPRHTGRYMSMHGAMGNASYVPPARPAVRSMKNNGYYGYRDTIDSSSDYTDVPFDPRHATRYPYN